MNQLEFAFFGLTTLLVLVGGVVTVAAKNPIRGAMGLLSTIVGIAGMYLMLSAEFLAAIQIMVYAGAVVVLFLFVIMLLGPSATSGRDTRTWTARYLGAGIFLAMALAAIVLLFNVAPPGNTAFGPAPAGLGTVEGIGHEPSPPRSCPSSSRARCSWSRSSARSPSPAASRSTRRCSPRRG